MPARRQNIEASSQVLIAQWLNARGVAYFHCPLEGLRSKAYAVQLAKMGTKAGIPDLLIPERAPAWQGEGGADQARLAGCEVGALADAAGPVGLAIELKVCRGRAKPSPAQRYWLGVLAELGWATACCNGVVETLTLLRRAGFDRGGFNHHGPPRSSARR